MGLLALSLIGVGLTTNSGEHLTQPVGRADPPDLTIASPPPGVPARPRAPPPSSATVGPNRTIDTAGGNLVARCEAGGAYLLYWSPSPGYRAHDINRGPSAVAGLTFEGNGREIKIRVTCIGLTVHPSIENDDNSGRD